MVEQSVFGMEERTPNYTQASLGLMRSNVFDVCERIEIGSLWLFFSLRPMKQKKTIKMSSFFSSDTFMHS